MEFKIIGDSCLDLTPELKTQLKIKKIPLSLMLGDEENIDDETLNLPEFMAKMKSCTEHVGSACPSPAAYAEAFESDVPVFAVTLSASLSGSYESAVMGGNIAVENGTCPKFHVFNSKSASCGETLIAMKIRDLESEGHDFDEIVKIVEEFIDSMKTYISLESLDNLIKNGRLGKIPAKILSAAHVKLIMHADNTGNIGLSSYAMGAKQKISRLISLIEKSCKRTEGERIVITHCCAAELAKKVAEAVQARFKFGEIHVIATGGLSSLYANEGGIVVAF